MTKRKFILTAALTIGVWIAMSAVPFYIWLLASHILKSEFGPWGMIWGISWGLASQTLFTLVRSQIRQHCSDLQKVANSAPKSANTP